MGEMTDIRVPEKRTVFRLAKSVWHSRVTQQAIPWCTTHDSKVTDPVDGDPDTCARGEWEPQLVGLCEISTGGPEHKWWVDL